MMKLVPLLVCLSAILFLLGCSAGRPFQNPDHGSMALGQTTEEQVVGLFGKPLREFAVTTNGEDMKMLQYYYVPGHRNPVTGISPVTTMFVYLWKDKLVRYEYTSTASETNTDFDTELVKKITKGSTTCSQVVELIGQPGGYAIFPGIPEHDVTAMVYFCEITTGLAFNAKIHRKILVLPFDKNGVILDVQLTETGQG
jgi:hypothetical protein